MKLHLTERRRTGAAVVEFAVVLPLFFLLVMGGIELGRAMLVRHSLEEAARAGCRLAVARGGTTADVKSIVTEAMNITSITGYTVTVNPDPPTSAAAKAPVTVSVSAPYNNVSWVPVPAFMGGKTIIGRCVMPAEGEGTTDDGGGSSGGGDSGKKKGKGKGKGKSKSKKK
jgi:Flp pilus assembly protein TadG